MPPGNYKPVKSHYEKIIVACCFLSLFVNIGLNSTSFAVYQPYIVSMPDGRCSNVVIKRYTLEAEQTVSPEAAVSLSANSAVTSRRVSTLWGVARRPLRSWKLLPR